MKTTLTKKLAILAASSLGLGLLTVAPLELKAQDAGSAKGGAAKLLQLTEPTPATPAVATVKVNPIMACGHCKDTIVSAPDREPRGAGAKALLAGGPPTTGFARHGCPMCGNEWVVTGHGKAKISTPVHTCCGACI